MPDIERRPSAPVVEGRQSAAAASALVHERRGVLVGRKQPLAVLPGEHPTRDHKAVFRNLGFAREEDARLADDHGSVVVEKTDVQYLVGGARVWFAVFAVIAVKVFLASSYGYGSPQPAARSPQPAAHRESSELRG